VKKWGMNDPGTYNPSQIYISFYQLSDQWVPAFARALTVAVRTPLDSAALMPAIRNAVYSGAPDQPIYDVKTMEEVVTASMAPQRFPLILLGAFSILALLLGTVGIYSLTSYSITQRIPEIGIRIALGAGRQSIFRMVIGQGLRLAIAGLAIGTAAAFILARLLGSFSQLLYGVRPGDPLTLAAVSLVLMSAALLACYLPARRATRIDPMQALRTE
jgi:ABC-type antimicrobial peptide transport system permease subunit